MSDNVGGRNKLDFGNGHRTSREKTSANSDMSVYKSSDEGSVRYEGSKESSVYKSSDAYFEYSCDPCSSAGDHLEAEGFCCHCREYLCGTCFRSHSRGKATKHHKLLNKDDMPTKQVRICDPCKTADEELEAIGYCENCEEYLCSSCFRSHSRSKATKHHMLMDKNHMPEVAHIATASSITKLGVNKEGATYRKTKEKYNYVQDINVKAEGDASDCRIIVMTLVSDNRLVLADQNNISLKLVDVERNILMGTLKLESDPYGLTTVSRDTVAVLLPSIYVIQIILVSGEISIQRSMKLTGQCVDIQYLNGKLYTSSYKPVNFQILQLSGAVYKMIKPEAEVLKHCTHPYNIAVSPNESVIYVSDWTTNTVMCVDIDGNMISIYKCELNEPMDIVITPFGSVYLCNRRQHVIYKMAPDLSEATAILGKGDGLHVPHAMSFDIAKEHLYISSGSGVVKKRNHIKVFKWQ